MLRIILLSIALMVGLGTIIPLATDYTEAGAHKPRKQKKKRVKYKKYSKKWWQAYRQRVRRNQAIARRKRAMRLRQIRLARANRQTQDNQTSQNSTNRANKNSTVAVTTPALLPSGETAPTGWKQGNSSSNELQYRVDDDNGAQIGSASISLVGPAATVDNNTNNVRNKTVGGIPTNSLRGTVIDRMIKENGWVVNDFQKEIGGKKVYVVVAQSEGAGGVIQSRVFYFTEVDGRIYSVSATSTTNSAERITQESEKVIDSLQRTKPQQASK